MFVNDTEDKTTGPRQDPGSLYVDLFPSRWGNSPSVRPHLPSGDLSLSLQVPRPILRSTHSTLKKKGLFDIIRNPYTHPLNT